MTLGRQTIAFEPSAISRLVELGYLTPESACGLEGCNPILQEPLLAAFGFSEVHSMDVSVFEGASHIHDLSSVNTPPSLFERYRVVFNGGTLEHVFDVANGIRTALAMVEPGGIFFSFSPINNWVDHGFYQFSPTLWLDLFAQNGWEVCRTGLVESSLAGDEKALSVRQLFPGEAARLTAGEKKWGHFLVARKPLNQTALDCNPIQSFYVLKHSGEVRETEHRVFESFDLFEGEVRAHRRLRVSVDPGQLVNWRAHAYCANARALGLMGGAKYRPFGSSVILFEDGKIIPLMCSHLDMVADRLPGRFCHQNWQLLFSASDGSDPRINGKRYEISLPCRSSEQQC